MVFIKTYKKYLTIIAVIWAACLVLLFAVYMLVLGPQNRSRQRLEAKLTKTQQMYESALKTTQEETKIKLNEQVERLRNRLGDFVVDFEDSANMTFDISRIASEKKVASFSIQSKDDREFTAIPNCNYLYENRIDIGFSSGFNQFATFLNALEKHRPVLFVNGFTIGISPQDDSSYQVSLNTVVLVRKPQDG